MSKIDYQALREIAKLATQGEWVAFISPGKYGTYAVHTPDDNHHGDIVDWPGFDEQKNAENNARYIAAFNPEVVQALLDENERMCRDLMARNGEIDGLRKRVEELEALAKASPVASCIVEDGGMCVDGFSEYIGTSWAGCAKEARKDGWRISKDKTRAFAPGHKVLRINK